MKIKVVDMPYEQALAQPREKHTLRAVPSMLFRALLRALSALTCARRIFAVTAWAWSGSALTSPVSF